MSIKEIININPNTLLLISAADLKEFALELLAEREKYSAQSDKYLTIAETVGLYVSIVDRFYISWDMVYQNYIYGTKIGDVWK